MATETFSERAAELANQAQHLAEEVASLAVEASRITAQSAAQGGGSALVVGLTVFVLAVFAGYNVMWRGTRAPPPPLVTVTHTLTPGDIPLPLISAVPPAQLDKEWRA